MSFMQVCRRPSTGPAGNKKTFLVAVGKEGACFADWLTPLPASRDQIKGILFMFQL
jgi:hypothetical protein